MASSSPLGSEDGHNLFMLGKSELEEALNLRTGNGSPLDIALKLFSARVKTEGALSRGYVCLDSIVQMAEVCTWQVLNFHSGQGKLPDSAVLYDTLIRYFEEAVNICAEQAKAGGVQKSSPVIGRLVFAASEIASGGIYRQFPQPYDRRVAYACQRLGSALALTGFQDERLNSLLEVR